MSNEITIPGPIIKSKKDFILDKKKKLNDKLRHHCKSTPNEIYLNELIKYEADKFPEKVNLNYYKSEVLKCNHYCFKYTIMENGKYYKNVYPHNNYSKKNCIYCSKSYKTSGKSLNKCKGKNKNYNLEYLNNSFFKLKIKKENINELINCPICLENSIGIKHVNKCNHIFHKKCYDKWINSCHECDVQVSCPICRKI